MQIWDTAGQERFKCSIPKDFYKNANGILLLYDITSNESFNNVIKWIEKIEDNAMKSIPIVLVGNKSDKINARKVTLSDGQEISKKFDILFFETSCKLNININTVFENLVDKMILVGKFKMETKNLKEMKPNRSDQRCCQII